MQDVVYTAADGLQVTLLTFPLHAFSLCSRDLPLDTP